jgi:hypothetical protein
MHIPQIELATDQYFNDPQRIIINSVIKISVKRGWMLELLITLFCIEKVGNNYILRERLRVPANYRTFSILRLYFRKLTVSECSCMQIYE